MRKLAMGVQKNIFKEFTFNQISGNFLPVRIFCVSCFAIYPEKRSGKQISKKDLESRRKNSLEYSSHYIH